MNLLTLVRKKILNTFHWFLRLSLWKKLAFLVVFVILLWLLWTQILFKNANAPQYQTATVTRGTLVVSLTESGQVAVANRMNVVTQASGVVSQVYVKNGDTVTKGEKIADITLDQAGQLRQTQANASYLSAQSNLAQANANMYSLQGTMFSDWNTYYSLATNSTYQNTDGSPNVSNRALPQFTTTQDSWLAAQANYQNQQTVVYQTQASLANAALNLQETSGTIVAPLDGVVSDLTLASGMQITNTTTSSSTTGSTNTGNSSSGSTTNIASISTSGKPVITVNLSEIDATKIHEGQQTTVTFDSLPNLTFTGHVIGINTTGVVSSGVTTYPATIVLDTGNNKILPNMGASASIITNVVDNTLLVPVAAVQTTGTTSTVRVLKNGQVSTIPVEVGLSSDAQTQITSGLAEGETVVTGVTSVRATGATTSPFGSTGIGGLRVGGGGFGGGGGGGRGGAATGR